jgi:hypothetical protein
MIGLAWHHWKADLTPPNQVRAEYFHPVGASTFEPLFANRRWGERLDATLGAGTFAYRAAQDPNAPSRTIWRFSIYGAVMGGVPGQPQVGATHFLTRTIERVSTENELARACVQHEASDQATRFRSVDDSDAGVRPVGRFCAFAILRL